MKCLPDKLQWLRSCGLLLVPIVLWNVAFFGYLPRPLNSEEFWRDIPPLLAATENISRVIVIAMPFLMPLDVKSRRQRIGLIVFLIGVAAYFASWLALMVYPSSAWSQSAMGFIAPAYTPFIWLVGIALIGERMFWLARYRWYAYLPIILIFEISHIAHTAIVFGRT